jgi:hypothetical protein
LYTPWLRVCIVAYQHNCVLKKCSVPVLFFSAFFNFLRLAHEIDFKKFDKNLQNLPEKGTRLVFEFFRGFNDFKVQKVYLLRLMPVYDGLIMVSCLFLSVPPITS